MAIPGWPQLLAGPCRSPVSRSGMVAIAVRSPAVRHRSSALGGFVQILCPLVSQSPSAALPGSSEELFQVALAFILGSLLQAKYFSSTSGASFLLGASSEYAVSFWLRRMRPFFILSSHTFGYARRRIGSLWSLSKCAGETASELWWGTEALFLGTVALLSKSWFYLVQFIDPRRVGPQAASLLFNHGMRLLPSHTEEGSSGRGDREVE